MKQRGRQAGSPRAGSSSAPCCPRAWRTRGRSCQSPSCLSAAPLPTGGPPRPPDPFGSMQAPSPCPVYPPRDTGTPGPWATAPKLLLQPFGAFSFASDPRAASTDAGRGSPGCEQEGSSRAPPGSRQQPGRDPGVGVGAGGQGPRTAALDRLAGTETPTRFGQPPGSHRGVRGAPASIGVYYTSALSTGYPNYH